jgi:signal transduction histidine kinase
MRTPRLRHLVFLAHIWACVPFLLAWTYFPQLRVENDPAVIIPMKVFCGVAAVYLVARTYLAWRDPPWLRWEYVFPVIDVFLISIAVRIRHDPDSVLTYLYFFPIAEAVGTLSVRWAALIGVMSIAGVVAGTWGQHGQHGFLAFSFRLIFLVVMALLLTWLARFAAELQAQLQVATDRNRIAMEMHDGVQAQLIAIASQQELARCVALQDGARAAQIAADSRDLARRAADDLRFLVHRLRAPCPAEGFVPALQQYVHNLSARSGLPATVQVTGAPYPLDPDVEHALFHIVQESLNNTLKHANAQEVSVTLDYGAEAVRCAIRDDGTGFDPAALPEEGGAHVGLESMRERARQAGGELRVESAPGRGTTVIAVIPRAGNDGGPERTTAHRQGR